MKSLKAYRNIQTGFNTTRQTETVIAEDYEGYCIEFKEDDEVYLKSEVDKVIEELEESHKKEVEQLLMEIVKLNEGAQNLILDDCLKAEKVRHSNYKRCLKNREICVMRFDMELARQYPTRAAFWAKWERKWLKLVEKFKDEKETLELVGNANALCKEAK